MAERASSSSSACSSSSADVKVFAPRYFPSDLKTKPMRLFVRNLPYAGHVKLVDQGKPLWSTVHFKMARPARDNFAIVGDLAKLESNDRRFWKGNITAIEHDLTGLSTVLQIRVTSAPEGKIVLEPSQQVLVMMKPVVKTIETLLPEDEENPLVKICISGFGKIERILVQMALQSIDVDLIAIYEPSMSLDRMIKVLGNTNLTIAVKDCQTLVFEKRYYKKGGNKTDVDVLLEQIEVTVFRKKNEENQLNADFVVELDNFFNNEDQSSEKNEILSNCLRKLPEELCEIGLYVDEPFIRAYLNRDNQNTTRRAASITILPSNTAAVEAVCKAFPEWDGNPTSLQFLVNVFDDRSADVDSSLDLKVKLEKAQNFKDTDCTAARLCNCDVDKLLQRRVDAIVRWCLDIVRCVPVGGCQLELI